jgi:phage I-like protein
MLMPMVREDAATTWIHVAFEGAWEGHRDGSFEFTRDAFDQICANFEANPNPVPMDYEHSIEYATKAPASGWVQKLEVRDEDGKAHLWAFCELTDTAAEHIRAGEYRYCSGVFDFAAIDLKSGDEIGCTMDSLALVNTPFIRGQRPVSLSRRGSVRRGDDSMTKDQIRALMAISKESLAAALDQIEGDEITPEQLEAAAQFAAAKDGEMEEPEEAPMAEGDPPEEEEEVEASAEPSDDAAPLADDAADVALQDPDADAALAALAPLMEATGLDLAGLTAALSENLDAVASALSGALQEPAADAPLGALPPGMVGGPASGPSGVGGTSADLSLSLRTTQTALATVTKERDTYASELLALREREADEAVALFVDCGAVLDDAAPDLKKLYLSDKAAFGRLSASFRKPVVPTGEQCGTETANTDAAPISADDEAREDIVALRAMLKRTGRLTKEQMDQAVRKQLALRRETAI